MSFLQEQQVIHRHPKKDKGYPWTILGSFRDKND